ncbi:MULTISPECIES: GNAT family N-acetyltransferase [unclassified Sphingomonas]|uniref:GNAT family N-acetyltransferase n=1 Tax=unclassified Sphingomonas TaxID=196159 RepID=UPI002455F538|nr:MULTISPECIES: GNAT family N-acetyltransferase [unclassified Sphingomonas]MDH4744409.1 GNAT family N-acetyltransferase [Sphingomonas sp. CBMAI 2297]
MPSGPLSIRPVSSKRDIKQFIEIAYRLNGDDPNWVAPLRDEVAGTISPKKNGWFSHAEAQLFLAERDGEPVGRISAHIDFLALEMPPEQGFGPGTGFWGMFEAADQNAAKALINAAEDWLRGKGMTRALGPVSLSIWEEPGLLVKGHDHSPTVLMGHHPAKYQGWIEAAGYTEAKKLLTYELDVSKRFPPLVNRIVENGEKNPRIRIRKVNKAKFAEEAAIILAILNDAWSDNWGFIPLTQPEIDDVGKKLKPLVFEDLIMIAELDGEPVAFMVTLPDFNEVLKPLKGSLLPFGWAKLLLWLRRPKARTMRVPLMGVVKRLQASRMASQLAFMMIEYIRRAAVANYGASRGEIGWILDDNQGMNAIADAIDSWVNREYAIYQKPL